MQGFPSVQEVFPLPVAQTLQCSAELKHLATASLSWLFLMLLLYIKHFYKKDFSLASKENL